VSAVSSGLVGALVTTFRAWVGFNRVEGTVEPVNGILIITEDAHDASTGERDAVTPGGRNML